MDLLEFLRVPAVYRGIGLHFEQAYWCCDTILLTFEAKRLTVVNEFPRVVPLRSLRDLAWVTVETYEYDLKERKSAVEGLGDRLKATIFVIL